MARRFRSAWTGTLRDVGNDMFRLEALKQEVGDEREESEAIASRQAAWRTKQYNANRAIARDGEYKRRIIWLKRILDISSLPKERT